MEHATELSNFEFDSRNISKTLRSSFRARAIAKRSKLSSADGNILDEHDQFYRDHKLLLKLFQVLGVMPIMRSEVGRITFSWTSKATIYALCLYCFTSVLVILVGWQRLDILLNVSKKFDEYIYSVLFIIFLVPHFWIPFAGWGVARKVMGYKNSWGFFQLRYYKITGKSVEFPRLSLLIIIISSGCLILAVVFLLSLSLLLDGFTLYHTTAYLQIITMINMNCALWYINCRALGDASKSLADSFEQDVQEKWSAYIVSLYRFLWLSLSDMLRTLGIAYARTYSAYSLFMFINITIAFYGFVSEVFDHGLSFSFKEIGMLVDCIYCMSLLFIFCDVSHKTSIKIAKRVQDTLMSVNMNLIDQATKREIDMFLFAIRVNPPVVSLNGYANVDRAFFTSSLTTMAIYLIVLIQFKLSLDMLQK